MNVIISQQAAENERSSRLSGIQMVDRACSAFIKGLTMTNAVVRAFRRAYSGAKAPHYIRSSSIASRYFFHSSLIAHHFPLLAPC